MEKRTKLERHERIQSGRIIECIIEAKGWVCCNCNTFWMDGSVFRSRKGFRREECPFDNTKREECRELTIPLGRDITIVKGYEKT